MLISNYKLKSGREMKTDKVVMKMLNFKKNFRRYYAKSKSKQQEGTRH